MVKILNTWQTSMSENKRRVYYELSELVYRNGDYAIYSYYTGYIYTYREIAINCLVGLNKEHLDRVAMNKRPLGEYTQNHFLFDRAIENKKLGLSLMPDVF